MSVFGFLRKKGKGGEDFITEVVRDRPCEFTSDIAQFLQLYDSMSDRLKAEGLSGAKIGERFRTNLTASCPKCDLHMTGADLGDAWITGHMGSGRVITFSTSAGTPDWARFGEGRCPNASCSSTQILLRWR